MMSTETWITLLGVRADGVASAVDLIWAADGDALPRARAFLDEHRSCDLVEVWADGRQVGRVSAADADA